ncbi:MAG: hypothetical protein HY717_03155, partial [Planctomycetes bacterium]|nr:hypothetical protein [Planctomycetota bacterium]
PGVELALLFLGAIAGGDDRLLDRGAADAFSGSSGAEIEQAVISSLYRALEQKRQLDTGLLLDEIRDTIPLSVSRRESIEELRRQCQGRFASVR